MSARLLAAGSVLWAALLPSAAFSAANPTGLRAVLATIVYGIGRIVCHQQPARSFAWAMVAWPVCARCTGIYVGAALAAGASLFGYRAFEYSPRRARLWVAAGVLPIGLSLVYEWSTGLTPSNVTRALTGLLGGFAVMLVLLAFLDEEDRASLRHANGPFQPVR